MPHIFTSTVDGLTVFATQPSLVAHFLHGSPAPDLSAWGSYLATGFFGASMSPVEGARLLHPGERLVAERHEDGWRIESQARIGVDAIVLAGRAAANRLEDALDEAAQALIGTATSLSQLYSGPIELGLSGGKDSRLIAAASLAAGLRPNLVTNIDVPEEGETASELVAIVQKTRGIDLNHRLRKVSRMDPASHWWPWPARSPTPRRWGSGPGRPPARCWSAASSSQGMCRAARALRSWRRRLALALGPQRGYVEGFAVCWSALRSSPMPAQSVDPRIDEERKHEAVRDAAL